MARGFGARFRVGRAITEHARQRRHFRQPAAIFLAFGFNAQQATHISISKFAVVVRLGAKTGAKLVKEIGQVLRQLLDVIQGSAPACNFSYWFRIGVIPSFIPLFRLSGEVT